MRDKGGCRGEGRQVKREQELTLKWIVTDSHSVGPNSLQPMDCSPPGSSVHGILQARILECPNLGIELRSPALQADSLGLRPWKRL